MPLKHTVATTIAFIIIIIISITISPSSSTPDYYEDLPTPQDNHPSTKHDHVQSTASPHHDHQHLTIQHDDDHENTSHNDYHGNGSHHNHDQHHGDHQHHGIHVASIKFDYVKQPLILSIFMIVVVLCKLGFHHANFLSGWMPESCLLIVLGVIVGAILHVANVDHSSFYYIHPDTFFLFLLPPCILEAAYGLHDPVFFENLGTILFYAIFGTLINCFIIGPVLYCLAYIGAMGTFSISLIECLVFSSLIVAVDPVAVLAIFQEVGVNSVLYFLVFGESLLNDAVTVVLYNTITTLSLMGGDIPVSEIGMAIAAFFVVSLGGLTIGLIFGLLSALITRLMMHIRVVEPLAILSMAYASYLMAELFHFSGIISMIGCGLMQMQFAFHNISNNSSVTIKYFSKMLSNACDCIIFMFLGISLIRDNHQWHLGFVLWSVVLCLAVRFIVTYGLTFLVNKTNRSRCIGNREQFIMAYGGLRGAVAFCLVVLLQNEHTRHKELFVTATLSVILFTVFVQGITIKPLVKLLRIEGEEEKVMCLYQEINNHVIDHLLVFMEEVIGHYGHNSFQGWLDKINDKYLKKILQRDPFTKDEIIMEVYQQIALQQHYESVYGVDMSSSLQLYRPEIIEKLPSEPASPENANNPSVGTVEDVVARLIMNKRRRYLSAASTDNEEDQPLTGWGGGQYGVYNTVMGLPPHVAKHLQAAKLAKRSNSVDQDKETKVQNPRSKWQQARSKIIRRLSTSPVDTPLITAPNSLQLRKMMIKAPTKDAFARRTDRNLKEADRGDLLNLLNEKQMRHNRFIKGQSGFTSNINTPIVNRSRAESLDELSAEEGKARLRSNTHGQLLLRKKVKTVDFEETEPPATLLAPHTAAVHYTPRYQQRRPTSSHGIIHPHVPHTVITAAERKRSSSGGSPPAGSGSLGNPGERLSSIGKSPISLQYINEEQEQPQQPAEESPLKAYNRKMEMEEGEMEKWREEDKGEKDGKKEKDGDGNVGTESDGDDGDHSGVSGVGGEVKVRTPLKRQDAGERAPKQKTDEKSL